MASMAPAGRNHVHSSTNSTTSSEATPDALRADYRFVAATDTPESTIETASSWAVEAGKPGAQQA